MPARASHIPAHRKRSILQILHERGGILEAVTVRISFAVAVSSRIAFFRVCLVRPRSLSGTVTVDTG